MSAHKQTLTFFGATGGCACNALALALKDGYVVTARQLSSASCFLRYPAYRETVARTPQKLRDMLGKEHALSAEAMNNLNIVQGNSTDLQAVKAALAPNGQPAGLIIVGVGGTPKLRMSLKQPVILDQPTICEDTCKTILSALRDLRREGTISENQKPTIVCISTTGLTKARDVPLELTFLYHYLLAVPHKDKALMEEEIARASTETGPDAPIASFIVVRPSLLMDGVSKGMNAVRVGWVEHEHSPGAANGQAPGAELGRTIRRADVGIWVYENAIVNTAEWRGRCVTLTY